VLGSIEAGETNATIAREVNALFGIETTRDSVRRFRRRHGVNIPGAERSYTKVKGDTAEARTAPRAAAHKIDANPRPLLTDPDAMLEERGLDPEEWYVDGGEQGVLLNEWDGPGPDGNIVTYYQAKFRAKRKKNYEEYNLVPVRSDGWRPPPKPRVRTVKGAQQSRLIAICGDSHFPFHDTNLDRLFVQWLREHQPQQGVDLGDLLDFPDLQPRHKPDPDNLAKAQECMQVAYNVKRGHLDASPHTEWTWILGNHDVRLYDYEAAQAPNSARLRTVDTPEGPGQLAHAISHLMRLDELGVTLLEPRGSYEDTQVTLSRNLAVRHGWIARKDGGASALQTLKATGFSILIGHTHRQSIVQHTSYEIDDTPRVLLGAEIGCMCRIDKHGAQDPAGRRWPNYMTLPDWQQGFATAEVFPDGKFKLDLATYVNGVLLWRDKRYE
jgi:hypothetical protein